MNRKLDGSGSVRRLRAIGDSLAPRFSRAGHTNILKSTLAHWRPRPIDQPIPHDLFAIPIRSNAPLLVVDVDEVLAMFMRGFERFVETHGFEMRITRFALFQNIFRVGELEHLDLTQGRALFDAFFETDVEHIDAAPGAAAALASLAETATVVILTNAPGHSREPRARWLAKHQFPYPLVINAGLKGPAVAALAARTSGATAFVDDLLPNLDSVAKDAPDVHRFQMVADARLRPLALTAPGHHRRIDEWPTLHSAIARVFGIDEAGA